MAARRISKKVKIIIVVLIALFIVIFLAFEFLLRPQVIQRAQAKAKSIASYCMNTAARENSFGPYYDQVIIYERDSSGNIVLVRADASKINELAGRIAARAQQLMAEQESFYITMPIGAILGGQLFSSIGPEIRIHCTMTTSVTTRFTSEFSNSGINQTRHRISAEVSTWIRLMMPAGQTAVLELTVSVPVCETIIIGNVPDTYLIAAEKGELLNLLP